LGPHSREYYGDFVTSAYEHYLGRKPDQGGLNSWTDQLQKGLSDERLEAAFIGSLMGMLRLVCCNVPPVAAGSATA
jgi:hypothetical protein